MTEISELDLQNLRHLIGGFDTTHCKMQDYAQKAEDMEVKQFSEIRAVCTADKAATYAVFTVGGGTDERKNNGSRYAGGYYGELVRYGEMIPQTENPELKQTLKQIRNQCEMSQEEIYRIARTKGYYVPAAKATREEVEHVRSVLNQG